MRREEKREDVATADRIGVGGRRWGLIVRSYKLDATNKIRFKIKTEIRMPRIKNAKKDKNNNDRVGEYEELEFIAFSQHIKKRYDYLTAVLIPEGTDTVRCNARTVSARR
jgi:hypothetical protein